MISRHVNLADSLYEHILEFIIQSGCKLHERLPSDRDFAEHFHVNRQTVYRAMAILAEKKIVRRQVGSGTVLIKQPAQLLSAAAEQQSASQEKNFGFLISARPGDFFAEQIRHYHEAAAQSGLTLRVEILSDDSAVALRKSIETLARIPVAAIVAAAPQQASFPIVLHELTSAGTFPPIVMTVLVPGLEHLHFNLGRHVSGINSSMLLALRFFSVLAYPVIAYFGPWAPGSRQAMSRLDTYCRYTHQHGLTQRIAVIEADEDCADTLSQWAEYAGVTGVIAYDDDYALKFLNTAQCLGMPVPGKFALIGFNDHPAGRMVTPALSTIPFAYRYMADAVLSACQARIEKRDPDDFPPIIPQITVRDSCGGRKALGNDLEAVISACRLDVQNEVQDNHSKTTRNV